MNQEKLQSLQNDFVFHLKHLAPDTRGAWGKMNGQQMVEHFTDMIRVANGKIELPDVFDKERIQKNFDWLMTDKPFRENTINPLLPEEPKPVEHGTMNQAIEALQQELNQFFKLYESNPELRVKNPIFGNLNYEEQVQLLYKHARHHLRQFGLISSPTDQQ